jgi:putative hydrolase of the HAD superfamily
MAVDLICLDADDTLWHNMRHFDAAERALIRALEPLVACELTRARMQEISARNLSIYGYGAKSFTLSVLETATELCGDALPAAAVREILAVGRSLLTHPVELLPAVATTLGQLALRARLVLVTKGDLLHQETKLAASGIGDRFHGVEIVSEKSAAAFRRLFRRYGAAPDRCVMAGDSIRSDILPALETGAWAAYVPHEIVWFHERAEPPLHHPRFKALARFAELPDWIDALDSQ